MQMVLAGKLVLVLATVLSIGPSAGSELTINRGLVDGLRPGDSARVFYNLKVGGTQREIEVGTGTILRVEDASASLSMDADAKPIREGYQVEISIPDDRISPASLLKLADFREEKGDFESALIYLKRLESMLPDDLLVRKRLDGLQARREEKAFREVEMGKLDYYRRAAKEFTDLRDEESARNYIQRILRVVPEDEGALQLAAFWDKKQREQEWLVKTTIFVPGGLYSVGLPFARASAYNQHPNFESQLETFRIDRKPVSQADFVAFEAGRGETSGNGSRTGSREGQPRVKPRNPTSTAGQSSGADSATSSPVTGVTFEQAEAYCESLGRRLPTEFEWEVAARSPEIDLPSLHEWTGSFYLPYPGNQFYEAEYGEKHRVIRGPVKGGETDLQARYFLAPEKSDPNLTFRCASPAEQ